MGFILIQVWQRVLLLHGNIIQLTMKCFKCTWYGRIRIMLMKLETLERGSEKLEI